MSPVLTLVLAAAISNAEPTREHEQIVAAAVELHASFERSTAPVTAPIGTVDIAFHYDFAWAAELASTAPDSPDSRARIIYSLSNPIFRDLL